MTETNTWSGEWRSSRPGRGPAARLFAARLVAVVRPHLGFSAAPIHRPPAGRAVHYYALMIISLPRPQAPSRLTPRFSRVSPPPSPTYESPARLRQDGAETWLVGPRHRRRLRHR